MPFTFSHPAIILPLTYLPRRWFSLNGLVIGSLTPDFEYFIRMKVQSNFGHSISGLFWFDLPLGIMLAFIFHNMVRDSLFKNLPSILNQRLIRFTKFDWNRCFRENWIEVTISILIGAASHIFWDSFTHEHGYFVNLISGLTNRIEVQGIQIPIYRLLQHVSTLAGALIIAIWILRLTRDNKVTGQINVKYWAVWIFVTVLIITARVAAGLDKGYAQIIVIGISAGFR